MILTIRKTEAKKITFTKDNVLCMHMPHRLGPACLVGGIVCTMAFAWAIFQQRLHLC